MAAVDPVLKAYLNDTSIPLDKRRYVQEQAMSGVSQKELSAVIVSKYPNIAKQVGQDMFNKGMQAQTQVKDQRQASREQWYAENADRLAQEKLDRRNYKEGEEGIQGGTVIPGGTALYNFAGGEEGIFGPGQALGFVYAPERFKGRAYADMGRAAEEGLNRMGTGWSRMWEADNLTEGVIGASEIFQGGIGTVLSPVSGGLQETLESSPSFVRDPIVGTVQNIDEGVTDTLRWINPDLTDQQIADAKSLLNSMIDVGTFGVSKAMGATADAAQATSKASRAAAISKVVDQYAGGAVDTAQAINKLDDLMVQASRVVDQVNSPGFRSAADDVIGKSAMNLDDAVQRALTRNAPGSTGFVDDVARQMDLPSSTIVNRSLDKLGLVKTQQNIQDALLRSGVDERFANFLSKMDEPDVRLFGEYSDVALRNLDDTVGSPSIYEHLAKDIDLDGYVRKIDELDSKMGAEIGDLRKALEDKALPKNGLRQLTKDVKATLEDIRAFTKDKKIDLSKSDIGKNSAVQKVLDDILDTTKSAQNYRDIESLSSRIGTQIDDLAKLRAPGQKVSKVERTLIALKSNVDDVATRASKPLKELKKSFSDMKTAKEKIIQSLSTKIGNTRELDTRKFLAGLQQSGSAKWKSVYKTMKDFEKQFGIVAPQNVDKKAFMAAIVEKMTGTPATKSMQGLTEAGQLAGKVSRKAGMVSEAADWVKSTFGAPPQKIRESLEKVNRILQGSDEASSVTQKATSGARNIVSVAGKTAKIPVTKAKELFKALYEMGVITKDNYMSLPKEVRIDIEALGTVVGREALEDAAEQTP